MLSIYAGKLTYALLNKFTNCTALPGKVAEKISYSYFKNIKFQNTTIIFITGTNGKTSTTMYARRLLEERQKKGLSRTVISNDFGSNMSQGIGTQIIRESKSGVIKDKILLFEVDELTLPKLIDQGLLPDYVLINNLSEDQIDRTGSVENVSRILKNALVQTKAKVILNRGDFYTDKLYRSLINEKRGLSLISFGLKDRLDDLDIIGDLDSEYLAVNNRRISISKLTIFDIYNSLAALSLIKTLESNNEISVDDFDYSYVFQNERFNGRMEKGKYASEDTILNLVKNPAGLKLTLEEFSSVEGPLNLLFNFGNRGNDGKDISWFLEFNFKKYLDNDKYRKIIITGDEISSEIAAKLDFTHIDNINNYNENEKTLFISSYSRLDETRNFLEMK